MITPPNLPILLQRFFCERLVKQRQVSPHTIKSYRDTFKMLLLFAQKRTGKQPSQLEITDIDAPLVAAFLDELEASRQNSARSRNARLAAVRSFFRFAAFEEPAHSSHIQRVLAIPSKRHTKALVSFVVREEIEALLRAPDTRDWAGRRDRALLLLAIQSGMRLSELTSLCIKNVELEGQPHVRVVGKGRKERCVPLTKQCANVLRAWFREIGGDVPAQVIFPNARGQPLSADGVQHILRKHVTTASESCPSLRTKRVTPHVLRHSTAMQLLQAGIDRSIIALWLGHESVETTQMYLHANLAHMESLLEKTNMPDAKPGRYHPDDQLLAFLKGL